MSSDDKDEAQHASSGSKPIPKKPELTIDNSAQCASFVSQRSSSIDTFGSISPTNSANELVTETSNTQEEKELGASALAETTPEENQSGNEKEVGNGNEEEDAASHQWLCNEESMPVSMLHPSHRSTPVKNDQLMSTVTEGEASGVPVLEADDDKSSENEGTKGEFMPGDLQTPITGFETMEARSRFTVYKIHVQKTASEEGAEPSGWFIFRRYSDFLHLNERLKHQFPGFRLSLPPKRWFRDNFDTNFLEDRMLGLQAFLDNITGHKDICNSEAVRAFFCTDEPPGPHDSLEESRALCDTLEETMYNLRQELQDKDEELTLLKEEVALYKSQVETLSSKLKAITGVAPAITPAKGGAGVPTSPTGARVPTSPTGARVPTSPTGAGVPTSPTTVSSGSNRSSLAECDLHAPRPPVSEESKSETEEVQESH